MNKKKMHRRNPSYATFGSFDKTNREMAPNFNYVQSQQQPHQQIINSPQNQFQPQPQMRKQQQPKFPSPNERAPKQPHLNQPPQRERGPSGPGPSQTMQQGSPSEFSITEPEIGVNVFYPPIQQRNNINRQPPQQFSSQLYGGMNNFSRNAVRK